jgi:formate-dependent nitrite reductase cytochrome c552 subunit
MLEDKKQLTPYEADQQKIAKARKNDQAWQAEIRARAEVTAANVAQAEAEQALKADELARYIASGGSEIQFNQDWPRLRRELIEGHYLANRVEPPTPRSQVERRLAAWYRRDK